MIVLQHFAYNSVISVCVSSLLHVCVCHVIVVHDICTCRASNSVYVIVVHDICTMYMFCKECYVCHIWTICFCTKCRKCHLICTSVHFFPGRAAFSSKSNSNVSTRIIPKHLNSVFTKNVLS